MTMRFSTSLSWMWLGVSLAFCLLLSPPTDAQTSNVRVTLESKNVTFEDALEVLHQKTKVPIIARSYHNWRLNRRGDVAIKDKPVDEAAEALARLFSRTWGKIGGVYCFKASQETLPIIELDNTLFETLAPKTELSISDAQLLLRTPLNFGQQRTLDIALPQLAWWLRAVFDHAQAVDFWCALPSLQRMRASEQGGLPANVLNNEQRILLLSLLSDGEAKVTEKDLLAMTIKYVHTANASQPQKALAKLLIENKDGKVIQEIPIPPLRESSEKASGRVMPPLFVVQRGPQDRKNQDVRAWRAFTLRVKNIPLERVFDSISRFPQEQTFNFQLRSGWEFFYTQMGLEHLKLTAFAERLNVESFKQAITWAMDGEWASVTHQSVLVPGPAAVYRSVRQKMDEGADMTVGQMRRRGEPFEFPIPALEALFTEVLRQLTPLQMQEMSQWDYLLGWTLMTSTPTSVLVSDRLKEVTQKMQMKGTQLSFTELSPAAQIAFLNYCAWHDEHMLKQGFDAGHEVDYNHPEDMKVIIVLYKDFDLRLGCRARTKGGNIAHF